jgi:hypothetical protein
VLFSKRNSHEQNRGTFLAEKLEAKDEYRNAQSVDHGIAERAYRENDPHQRCNAISLMLKKPVQSRRKRGRLPSIESCPADHHASAFSNNSKRLLGHGT